MWLREKTNVLDRRPSTFFYVSGVHFMSMANVKEQRIAEIFSCTKCGYCCQGETTVSLNLDDQDRMVRSLGLPREVVEKKFWRVSGRVIQMKTVDGHCIFYDEQTGCAVHKGRPWRCGQWPLHPSILSDKANLETIRESCPGLNKELSYEEFCTLFRKLVDEDKSMMI